MDGGVRPSHPPHNKRSKKEMTITQEQQKEIAKTLKSTFKTLGYKVSATVSQTKGTYISVYLKDTDKVFSADIRNLCLTKEYGEDFKRNEENPSAGNVRQTYIILYAHVWVEVLKELA
jgi:hypothetical protein